MIGSLLLGWLLLPAAQAQAFYGYQTIGVNTFYCAISWQHQRPTVGIGYARRVPLKPFADVQVEWHVPFAEVARPQNYQLIAGFYAPTTATRVSLNTGVHARLTRRVSEGRTSLRFGLATTLLPSVAISAPLDQKPYVTAGVRATYELVIAARTEDGAGAHWDAVPVHRFEAGGHADLHLDRTLGLGLNAYATRAFARDAVRLEGEDEIVPEGNLYMGATYNLRRW